MDAKHTPGPWFVTGKGLSRYVEGCVSPGVVQEVAWCGATEVPEQMEANARLIGAAPELIEAAKAALNYIENTESELGIKLNSGDKLRWAIAKATGA